MMTRERQTAVDRPPCGAWARAGLGLVVAWCALAVTPALHAGSGQVIHLGGLKPKCGLKLQIDTRWVDGNGYRPVRIRAINWPPGPTPADRTIRVVLMPSRWQWGQPQYHVTQFVEIPEGAAQAEATVAVPQTSQWGSLETMVFEDGKLLKELSGPQFPSNNPNREWTEARPAILVIDADAPTRDEREALVRPNSSGPGNEPSEANSHRLPDIRYPTFDQGQDVGVEQAVSDWVTLTRVQDLARLEMLPPAELPQRWIDYTCFDLIAISWTDLQSLASQHGERCRALRAWLRSGPTLLVYDIELTADRLRELETLLELSSEAETDGTLGGWRRPQPKVATTRTEDIFPKDSNMSYVTNADGSVTVPASKSPPDLSPPKLQPGDEPFVFRAAGLGRVVALRTRQPFTTRIDGSIWLLDWVLNELGTSQWMWYQRHGFSLHRENDEWWNLMIPGVGRAPVGSYLILITLFVIVIGPVNYLLLRRRRRLYMLLVTVPAGAAAVTGALLTYALISDGLGVRVRVRSFTDLDQRTGRTASWSRQAYYAGLAPSGGLAFPADAAVYPLDEFPTGNDMAETKRYLTWSENQELVAGYLGSRSTAQFMVIRAAETRRGLKVVDGAGDPPAVTNELGTAIGQLALRDAQGRWACAENIAAGATFRPQWAKPEEVAEVLKLAFNSHQTAYPVGFDPNFRNEFFAFGSRYYYGWSGVDNSLAEPTLMTGILERNLIGALVANVSDRPPRSYIAVTDRDPEVPLGHPRAQSQASFHVISGRW